MNRSEETASLSPWGSLVPKDWEVCRLDNVADVIFSNVDKHTKEGETPVLLCNYIDVYKNDRIVNGLDFMEATAELHEINKFQIRRGDVLATKDSEEPDDIAIPSLVAEELPGVICGYHLALIRTRSKRITSDFLAWLHRSKQFRVQYEAKAVGVTRFGLSQYAFREALIPLPPPDEQVHINTYLDYSCAAIDASVAAKRRQLEILDAVRRTTIQNAITKGLIPSARTRKTGIQLMETIPAHWETDRLKDVATINLASLSANTDPSYEFDYLEISNVNLQGIINTNAIEHMRFEDAPSRARRLVLRHNTLASSVRPNLQAVLFVLEYRLDFVCSTGFNVVQANESKLKPKFLYYALISDSGRQYFEANAKGVGYPAVDDKDFSALVLPLPPLEEQEAICVYLDTKLGELKRIATSIETQITTLTSYRQSLIYEYVTGQRRVTELDLKQVSVYG
jgi:type I restriction enzyme S subunit